MTSVTLPKLICVKLNRVPMALNPTHKKDFAGYAGPANEALRIHFTSVNTSRINVLKHLAIVAIVDVNSDKNWTRSIECLFQHRGNLIW